MTAGADPVPLFKGQGFHQRGAGSPPRCLQGRPLAERIHVAAACVLKGTEISLWRFPQGSPGQDGVCRDIPEHPQPWMGIQGARLGLWAVPGNEHGDAEA